LAENLGSEAAAGLAKVCGSEITVVREDGYEAMAYADIVLSSCGTANLEVAVLGTPLVAFYRVSPLTYYPFRRLLKIDNYSIVNILAGQKIVPELIQGDFNPRRLAEETRSLLSSAERRSSMRGEFGRLRESLGEGRAAAKAARVLAEILDGRPSR